MSVRSSTQHSPKGPAQGTTATSTSGSSWYCSYCKCDRTDVPSGWSTGYGQTRYGDIHLWTTCLCVHSNRRILSKIIIVWCLCVSLPIYRQLVLHCVECTRLLISGAVPIQLKMSSAGVPVQTMAFGKCSYPDCPYPKRTEGGKVHDYCSRTCAQKHGQMKAFQQQAGETVCTYHPYLP